MLTFLIGKRTYILSFLGSLIAFLHQMSYLSDHAYQSAVGFLGFLGLITLHLAVVRTGQAVAETVTTKP